MSGDVESFWKSLGRHTQARIGLGRAGDALPTHQVLALRTDHSAARDAVHTPLDVDRLRAQLGPVPVVRSRATTRAEYLRRPDLGRRLAEGTHLPPENVDLAVVIADGLSPTAVQRHAPGLVTALAQAAEGRLRLSRPVVALEARVAIGDQIAELLGAPAVVVLVGERPGLSTSDSLGAYLTHGPVASTTDADRNCVSNIHPPEGLDHLTAARVLVDLATRARQLGRSGVDLKVEAPVAPDRPRGGSVTRSTA